MKTNNEKVLRYLAELMDEEEKSTFEKEVANSDLLKNYITEVQNRVSALRVDNVEVDERYFGALLPRVRRQIEKKEKLHLPKKIYYFVPYLAAAIIGLLFLFKPTNNFDYQYKDLAGKVVKNMTDQEVASKYFDELDSEPVVLETSGDPNSLSSLIPANVDVNGESTSAILNGSSLDEYGTFYGYSDDQLKTIAADLDKLNIK